ncbi:ATP-binding cassette domain-containing protein [Mesomycoplasma neurolyticum]|uniref:ABC-type maltose/maltodextrin transporter ATP-binding protein MalK n=1 Tax=Mesomycoplasma neurolyticum TaxID=2120 RepID=A0A449A4N3_9BACT|nr:ATP-binding cassette domain-containing protein [Mesomycoplasma neurolyticum]VEU59198.1 ABC-type maltose/maltodextrin transporter ATP-binding protein MalK [Mesomycoplasma neurolyticum]
MKKDNLIEINNLLFKYDKENILNIKKLEIKEKKWISIVGPSGAGKTTLLNLISQINIDDTSSIKLKNNLKTHEIGYILQNHALYEEAKVSTNIYLSAKNSFKWKKEKYLNFYNNFLQENNISNSDKIKKILKKYNNSISEYKAKLILLKLKILVSLKLKTLKNIFVFLKQQKLKSFFNDELKIIAKKLEIQNILNKKAKNISGGQKQRVAIAKALIKKNILLLLDEPFSALDVQIKEKTLKLLKKIKEDFDLSIVMVTHDQNDALKISDKILLINKGQIIQYDEPQKIFEKPFNLFAANFFSNPSIVLIKKCDSHDVYIREDKIFINLDSSGDFIIKNKKYLGNNFLYTIYNPTFEITWKSMSKNNFNVNDRVKVYLNKKDFLFFNKEGIRYEKNT